MNSSLGYQLSPEELNNLLAAAEQRYGSISPYYLNKLSQVIANCLDIYPRVFAVRVDLRLPQANWPEEPDIPLCFPRPDSAVISRFFGALKSQLVADHYRKGRRGPTAFPAYIWVREQDSSASQHYHLVLLFNKDVYAYLGDYHNAESDNMAIRIQCAWCSALGLTYPDYASLVHFPKNPAYVFDRRAATVHSPVFRKFLLRAAYLAKTRTKVPGQRNFGSSQLFGKSGE
ncbi:inovirus Gp2 family protein [Aeromonas veronii]|uniref:inovirus Gp2 family protein n=1 Tax=Aeromonas veronii TaxID=654 RepID=UPI002247713C|nr:inovirus Gp2 family protein [Aeromonas veronii]MCX0441476.1 inovirus Gp2 family protein [Aeromonas veronii]